MSQAVIECAHCGTEASKDVGTVNRSRRIGAPVFCSRVCAGLSRRTNTDRTSPTWKRAKSEYDAQRRERLGDRLRAEKREYFQRTYDPAKARELRRPRLKQHAEYCRRYYADPQKKAGKVAYDLRRREAAYADFAEAWRLLVALEREIRLRCPDKYERAKGRGYFEKINERKRYERQNRRTA